MNKEDSKISREINIKRNTFYAGIAEPVLLVCADYLMVMLAVFLALKLRQFLTPYIGMPFDIHAPYLYFRIPMIFVFFLHTNSVGLLGRPFWKTIRRTFWDVFYGLAALILLMYFGHVANNVSRLFLGFTGIFVFILITCGRYLCKQIMSKVRLFQMPVIFLGAGLTAEKIMESFPNGVGYGYRVIGFIDDDPVSEIIPQQYRILGGFDEADKIIRLLNVKHVIIAAPGLEQKRQIEIVNKIQPYVDSVSFVPDLMGAPGNLEIISLADAGLMMIQVKNNLAKWYNRLFKRVFDLICCLLGFVFIVPILMIIAVLIYLDDGGPILFKQARIGKNGKEFTCYKFRSMCRNADGVLQEYLARVPAAAQEWEQFAKLKNDPRITKSGQWLRKYSLDELPQLINVIKGEMSLVGPRPYLPREKEKMGEYYTDICQTLPGITGLWQVSGRNEILFSGRLKMDSWYVHNWSVWMDIAYLWKTVGVVLNRKGAY